MLSTKKSRTSREDVNMQGYHLSYPLTVSELTAKLNTHAGN